MGDVRGDGAGFVMGSGVTRRVAELARSGRPLLIDFTENECVAAATADVAERITVAAGRPIGDVPATALLVRPDGYVAWASSATKPEVNALRGVLQKRFGVTSRSAEVGYFELISSSYFFAM
jgi:hypothetical protein